MSVRTIGPAGAAALLSLLVLWAVSRFIDIDVPQALMSACARAGKVAAFVLLPWFRWRLRRPSRRARVGRHTARHFRLVAVMA